jgi:hypothetical protein
MRLAWAARKGQKRLVMRSWGQPGALPMPWRGISQKR